MTVSELDSSLKTLGSAERFLRMASEQNSTPNKPPLWMGILNVTPDSFSDGGCFEDSNCAVERAIKMVSAGAQLIDVGGVSTRPGSQSVSSEIECRRVLPVLQKLRQALPQGVLLSLDTCSAVTALEAAKLGIVDMINDVCAGRQKGMTTIDVAARFQLAWVAMHMLGTPKTMQDGPTYDNCIEDVTSFLRSCVVQARSQGVCAIVVDPGIGFGKRFEDNLALLSEDGIRSLQSLSVPVLIGLSRKKFLTQIFLELQGSDPTARDARTKQLEWRSVTYGANIIRTHVMPCEVNFTSGPTL